jgi:hypothetical protein
MQQDLEDLLLFEHTISQMFDSETRIALAVLEKVREIKKKRKDDKRTEIDGN